MLPTLTPSQLFTLVYQLGSPGDTGTYFVQAIVRYASSGTIIATVNLANQGNQRFTGTFTVPADVGGSGYYLDITYTVYTNSLYTILSQNYGIQNVVGKVLQSLTVGMGIGGGDGVSEIELRKILEMYFGDLKTHVSSSKEMIDEEFDWSEMHERMDGIESAVSSAKDYSLHLDSIKNSIGEVRSLASKIPTSQKEISLEPVLRMMKTLDFSIRDAIKEIRDIKTNEGKFDKEDFSKKLKEASQEIMSSLFEQISKMVSDKMENTPFNNNFSVSLGNLMKTGGESEKESKPKYDFSKIMPSKSQYAPKKK